MRPGSFVALFLMAGTLSAAKLYLKTRTVDPTDAAPVSLIQLAAVGDAAQRAHWLVQFDHAPGPSDIQALTERGATIGGYVHENALVISAEDVNGLADLGLLWIGNLEAADKVSPLLAPDESGDSRPVLVEFYLDVSLEDARRTVNNLGLVYSDNPDAGAHRLIVFADPVQVAALSVLDEVAYIFPASEDLVLGRPVIACAGAETGAGPVGQYIAVVGNGWGGSDHKAVSLGYYFTKITAQLPVDLARAEVVRAFNEWSKYVQVTFSASASPDASRSVNVLFATGNHGDGYAFDSRGGALAHTFYPSPPNPEPLAGDMHFDDNESWRIGADTDLYSVALHETGHALGLGHSDRPGTVMYPYYARAVTLTADDIAAVRTLYPAQTADSPSSPAPVPLSIAIAPPPLTTTADSVNLTGTSAGGTGTVAITWSTDRGRSGTALGSASWTAQVPLVAGANNITVTARDSQSQTASKSVAVARQSSAPATPVSIQIVSPSATGQYKATTPSVVIRGSASHSSGIKSVTWSSDRGYSGQSSGTTSWDSGPVVLQSGTNNVTVKATANDATTGAQMLVITYQASTQDTTAPSITITNPASPTSSTTAATITLRGTATDSSGVSSVTWSASGGSTGTASGTSNWTTAPIPLILGYNAIQIRATDAAGNTAWRSISVTRR